MYSIMNWLMKLDMYTIWCGFSSPKVKFVQKISGIYSHSDDLGPLEVS